MAIDRQGILNQKKKQVQDYLTNYPSTVTNQFQDVQNILNRPQDDLMESYKQRLSQYGNEYNINPRRVDVLANSLLAPKLQQQNAQSKQALDQAKYQSIRANYNRVYNYAVDNLMQQGADLETAEAQARQVADTWQQQQFQAGQAQTKREQYMKKSDIANQYENSATMLGNQAQDSALQDQIQQVFMRQLLGLGGNLGAGYVTGAFKGEQGKSTTPNVTQDFGFNLSKQYPYNVDAYKSFRGTGNTVKGYNIVPENTVYDKFYSYR